MGRDLVGANHMSTINVPVQLEVSADSVMTDLISSVGALKIAVCLDCFALVVASKLDEHVKKHGE